MSLHTEQLTDENLSRYRRQLILKEIGAKGQLRLMKSRVVIIGAGGLGSPVALYLAAAGVGTIGIVDSDKVDLSNLQRQILHTNQDIGEHKVVSAQKKLQALDPGLEIKTYNTRISKSNITDIITGYDLVINAVDNLETRYIINDACVLLQIPLVEGAIYHFEGYVMTIIPGVSACYRCLFPHPSEACSEEIGVVGVLPGIIGTMQATEALKYLLNIGRLLKNSIVYYNALEARFREISTQINPDCDICAALQKHEKT